MLIGLMLVSCAQVWALSCSDPVTLSDPSVIAYDPVISTNENGAAVLSWRSREGKDDRLEVSHKTPNSFWSSPEHLTSWEKDLDSHCCFINAEGDLFAKWETEIEEEKEPKAMLSRLHFAEKAKEKSWDFRFTWAPPDEEFFTSDEACDSVGNLIFIGEATVPCTLKPTDVYNYKTIFSALALFSKAPGEIDLKSNILPLENSLSVSQIRIAINKNGVGYVIWADYKSDNKSLMCQKIVNGNFISKPEFVCSLNERVSDIKADINEKGDLAIAYVDRDDRASAIVKTENSWSPTLIFADDDDDLSEFDIAIDSSANVMIASQVTINRFEAIKTIYKAADQPWESPILFSSGDAECVWPDLKPDGKGNFVMIWQQAKKGRGVIFGVSFSTATRSWSDSQRLSFQGESCFGYTYNFSAPGRGYIAWIMTPNGFDTVIQVAELFN